MLQKFTFDPQKLRIFKFRKIRIFRLLKIRLIFFRRLIFIYPQWLRPATLQIMFSQFHDVFVVLWVDLGGNLTISHVSVIGYVLLFFFLEIHDLEITYK